MNSQEIEAVLLDYRVRLQKVELVFSRFGIESKTLEQIRALLQEL